MRAVGSGLVLAGLLAGAAVAAEPGRQGWSFDGPFGTLDRASAQRGFAIYSQICATCHSLRHVTFGDLTELGLSPEQLRDLAAAVQVPGGVDGSGQPVTRPATLRNHFPLRFTNEAQARAANAGAVPPDLSDIVLSRPGGAPYVQALLTGYKDPPPGAAVPDGLHWNISFPGHRIAMPQMLFDGQITFAGGRTEGLAQEAHDVATFLYWTSHPHFESRRRLGVRVVLFLAILTVLVALIKRRRWKHV